MREVDPGPAPLATARWSQEYDGCDCVSVSLRDDINSLPEICPLHNTVHRNRMQMLAGPDVPDGSQ